MTEAEGWSISTPERPLRDFDECLKIVQMSTNDGILKCEGATISGNSYLYKTVVHNIE
jgi:hypothetical protein